MSKERLPEELKKRAEEHRLFPADYEKRLEADLANYVAQFHKLDVAAFTEEQKKIYDTRFEQFEQFAVSYYIKFLEADKIPSWMVTGRANYDFNKFDKQYQRQMKIFEDYLERSAKFIRNTLNMLKKADKVKTQAEKENKTIAFSTGTILVNYAAERIQVFFDDIPEEDVRGLLKQKAFKWSPKNKCWQRKITQNTVYALQVVLGVEVFEI